MAEASIESLPTRDGYDRWAAVYDGEKNPLVMLEEPLVAELLGDARGLSALDVGCGTGRHALRLAAEGATVTAVDFSQEMLARARAKPGAERVRFVRHDLLKPVPFENASFDRVVCGLVLDHIPDPAALLREMGRVCRPDGFVVVSAMHPAMMERGVQARFVDPTSGREVRPESCPHELDDYRGAIERSGLALDEMSEHAADDSLAARAPRAAKYVGWRMLLLLRLSPS